MRETNKAGWMQRGVLTTGPIPTFLTLRVLTSPLLLYRIDSAPSTLIRHGRLVQAQLDLVSRFSHDVWMLDRVLSCARPSWTCLHSTINSILYLDSALTARRKW